MSGGVSWLITPRLLTKAAWQDRTMSQRRVSGITSLTVYDATLPIPQNRLVIGSAEKLVAASLRECSPAWGDMIVEGSLSSAG